MQDDLAGQASHGTVLAGDEVDRRKAALTRLQDALAARGVESVLVGRHTMTLRGAGPAPPPGPGDPELHVFAADHRRIITTDGRLYRFAGSGMHPADDPCGAAGCLLPPDLGHDAGGHQAPAPADHEFAGVDAGELVPGRTIRGSRSSWPMLDPLARKVVLRGQAGRDKPLAACFAAPTGQPAPSPLGG